MSSLGYTQIGGKDWFVSNSYQEKEIEKIKDPEGGIDTSLPTAIPSPFARIDLVKTAFRNIISSQDLKEFSKNGNVIVSKNDVKLVSDTLDLFEILFNYDIFKDEIEIVKWDKKEELSLLLNGNISHKRFAETLQLYLDQDDSYNFNLTESLYLFKFNHKVIGCTSPVTMFFTTANDLSHAQRQLTTSDMTFDDNYTPLYERDEEFQKYIYTLFESNNILKKRLPDFYSYLEKNKQNLDTKNHNLYDKINRLSVEDYNNNYSEISGRNLGDIIEVLGIPIKQRKKEAIDELIAKSDFIINSSKVIAGKKPLVLQNHFNKRLVYIKDSWDSTTVVPYINNENNLERRILPGKPYTYPYLTVSDFLLPYLFRMVYPINKQNFFNGNIEITSGNDSKGYLLPLSNKFFEYFNSEDLIESGFNKPKINLTQIIDSVKVTLQIPIAKSGEFISFERIYYSSDNENRTPEIDKNKGLIVEHQIGVTVFPLLKPGNSGIEPHYRVQLIDRNNVGPFKNSDYLLEFYNNKNKECVKVLNEDSNGSNKPRSRSNKITNDSTTQYYVLNKEFDYIQIKDINNPVFTGIVIPKWKVYQGGSEKFDFAIDFGTTNTHVEYKTSAKSPIPFDITERDTQISTLFDPVNTSDDFSGSSAMSLRRLIDLEFVPELLGPESKFKFPTRTVSAEGKNLDLNKETYSLSDFNIPFTYEKLEDTFNEIKSNLKWSKSDIGNTKRIKAYFENLFLLLRNKVLLNDGNINETGLVWFFPTSMSTDRKDKLKITIEELFTKYFNSNQKAIGISESIAPFYFYKSTGRIAGGTYSPVISVDIGGGTTDIVVFQSNRPILISSFKFAANSIFGDGYVEYGSSSNGLVKKYSDIFEKLLTSNKIYDLIGLLNSIKAKNKSEDIFAFLFSLENNYKIRDKDLFSFNNMLSEDKDYKILVLYFYTTIIYHVVKLIQNNPQIHELPKNIVFSGTGSKILSIITKNETRLSQYTQIVFEKVLNKEFGKDKLKLKSEFEIPKEITCKGGLMSMSNAEDLEFDVENLRQTLTCTDQKELKYNDLNNDIKLQIVKSVEVFNEFFISLNKVYDFENNFGISQKSISIFKSNINSHLRDFLEEGIDFNSKLDESNSDEKVIRDSMFFYPIIGTINNLSTKLSELNSDDQ
jgi:hypothetical protein